MGKTDPVDRALMVAYLLLFGGWVCGVALMACPPARHRLQAAWAWARWHRWRVRWEALEPWQQEALTVRGRGPEGG